MALPESVYRDLFAAQFRGTIEHPVPLGRIDVLTKRNAVEVEPFGRWRVGARQALTYAAQVSRRPAIATYGQLDQMDCLKMIERVGDLMDIFVLAGTSWEQLFPWHIATDQPVAVGSDEDIVAALSWAKLRRKRGWYGPRPSDEELRLTMRRFADAMGELLGDGRPPSV